MINKILPHTNGKPCTCPSGNLTTDGTIKKGGSLVKRVVVEDASRLPVPIKISTFNTNQPTTVQFFQKRRPWRKQEEVLIQPKTKKGTNLCRWYRKRKAQRALEKLKKLEQKRQLASKLDKARRDRETEFLEALKLQEKVRLEELAEREEKLKNQERQLRRQAQLRRGEEAKKRRQEQARRDEEAKAQERERRQEQARLEDQYKAQEKKRREELTRLEEQLRLEEKRREEQVRKVEPQLVIEPKKTKAKRVYRSGKTPKTKPTKQTSVKPVSASRFVSVKTLKPHKESLDERFVNFCYRLCCQFYCCLTIILIIGCIIIFVIP